MLNQNVNAIDSRKMLKKVRLIIVLIVAIFGQFGQASTPSSLRQGSFPRQLLNFSSDPAGTEPSSVASNLISSASGRQLFENPGSGMLSVTYDDGINTILVNVSKCATRWNRVLGPYTFLNQSQSSTVTWREIWNDAAENAHQYNGFSEALAQGLFTNVDLLQSETQGIYEKYVCGYGNTTAEQEVQIIHDELRRLLQISALQLQYILAIRTSGYLLSSMELVNSMNASNTTVVDNFLDAFMAMTPLWTVLLSDIRNRMNPIPPLDVDTRVLIAQGVIANWRSTMTFTFMGGMAAAAASSENQGCIPQEQLVQALESIGSISNEDAHWTTFASNEKQIQLEANQQGCSA